MLKFAASRHNWTVQNWRRFLFVNKSPFIPFHPHIRQNNRYRAHSWLRDASQKRFKQPLTINDSDVWMICFRSLTHYEISFTGTAEGGYLLLEKILNKIRLSAMTNWENKGSSREIKVLTNMSMAITKKDNILGYQAPKRRKWCRLHFQAYWAKGEWRGNSSALSRIKDQWAIIQEITTYTKCRENLWWRPSFEHPNRWIGISLVPLGTQLSGMLGRLLAASETFSDGYVKILWLTESPFSSGE